MQWIDTGEGNTMKIIEICLDSIESIIAAEAGGADRVEFCSDLFEGGLTPTLGMFKVAKAKTTIPINVMIRPRGGDFCYSDLEFEAMKEDVRLFKEAGANAIVFGILTPEGRIDKKWSECSPAEESHRCLKEASCLISCWSVMGTGSPSCPAGESKHTTLNGY